MSIGCKGTYSFLQEDCKIYRIISTIRCYWRVNLMKLVRFRKDNSCSYGLLEDEKVKVIYGDIFKDYRSPTAIMVLQR